MDSQGHRDCPACLLQAAASLGITVREGERRTAQQLYKHRLVSGLMCLITDVSMLRNVVTEGRGMISVHLGRCNTAHGTLTPTGSKRTPCFHVLFNCHVTASPNSVRTNTCKETHCSHRGLKAGVPWRGLEFRESHNDSKLYTLIQDV